MERFEEPWYTESVLAWVERTSSWCRLDKSLCSGVKGEPVCFEYEETMYFHSFSFRLRCVDCRAHWCECVDSVIYWPGLRMSGDAQGEEWDWEQLWHMFHQSRNIKKKIQFTTEENTLTHSLSGGEARRTSTTTREASKVADRRVFWTHCKQNNNPERLTIKAHNWHQNEPGPRYTVLSSARTFIPALFQKSPFLLFVKLGKQWRLELVC